jgi:hypothetical protein
MSMCTVVVITAQLPVQQSPCPLHLPRIKLRLRLRLRLRRVQNYLLGHIFSMDLLQHARVNPNDLKF